MSVDSPARTKEPIRLSSLAGALLLSAIWLGVNLLPFSDVACSTGSAPGLDAHIYMAMAEAPTIFTMPPFAFRIGVPLVVHWLPFSIGTGFFLVTCAGLLATPVLAYVLFRHLGFAPGLALLGLTFVATAPAVPVYLENRFLVDPLAFAFLTALLLAIEKDVPPGPLALLLLVASLVKESAFYVVPVLYLRSARGSLWDRRAFVRVVLISLPAILAALLLRIGWMGELVGSGFREPWAAAQGAWFGSMASYERLWGGLFGYLALLALANGFSDPWRPFVRRYAPYMVIVIAQLLVPLNFERLLFFGFPVVIPLALAEFERIRDELPEWFPLLATLLVFCYLFLPRELVPPLVLVIFARVLMERRRGARASS